MTQPYERHAVGKASSSLGTRREGIFLLATNDWDYVGYYGVESENGNPPSVSLFERHTTRESNLSSLKIKYSYENDLSFIRYK